jgi:hypothetical protein
MRTTTLLLLVALSPVVILGQADVAEQPPPATIEQPFHVTATMRVTAVRWVTDPPEYGRKSLFEGRCSNPSDYVVSFAMEGDEPVLGGVTGEASHCSQIEWVDGRPAAIAYSDGVFKYITADGGELRGTYTDGTTTWDEATQSGTCHDELSFIEGTGRFAGVSGRGEDRCTFGSLEDALAGVPAPLETIGSIVLVKSDS